jgi:hypothetical protein
VEAYVRDPRPISRLVVFLVSDSRNLFVSSSVLLSDVGYGLMGVVRIAKHKATDSYIAIKAIRKEYIAKHHDGRHVANEKEALNTVYSPFVPTLFGALEDFLCACLAVSLSFLRDRYISGRCKYLLCHGAMCWG